MPTPIRMVPLDDCAWLLDPFAASRAVLAIPVQGDGIWLEGITKEDVRAFVDGETSTSPYPYDSDADQAYNRAYAALNKAAGA